MPEAFIVDAVRTPVTRRGVGLGAGQQGADHVRAEIGRVRAGQSAAAAGDRGAHGVDDEGLGQSKPYSERAREYGPFRPVRAAGAWLRRGPPRESE